MNIIKPGTVVKMWPTDVSHEKEPYYALIKFYDSNAVLKGQIRCTTTIPGRRTLQMQIGINWEYHWERMQIVGDIAEFGYLLYNQNFQYNK